MDPKLKRLIATMISDYMEDPDCVLLWHYENLAQWIYTEIVAHLEIS